MENSYAPVVEPKSRIKEGGWVGRGSLYFIEGMSDCIKH